nr:hypothetical protein [uncultured Oscillibacter sp.]
MRKRLLAAVENTPEDALFLAGLAVNEHEDFLKGLCLNRSRYFTRAQVLEQIERSAFQVFPAIPGFDDHLLLTPRLYVWKDSINRSQRFPATPEADTYTHVQGKSNPYYDIFFRMDTERKTIVFALGERKKEISVTEHTEWCWKLTRRDLRCQNMERLEQSFLDPFWNPIAVHIGRKALGIKPAV